MHNVNRRKNYEYKSILRNTTRLVYILLSHLKKVKIIKFTYDFDYMKHVCTS